MHKTVKAGTLPRVLVGVNLEPRLSAHPRCCGAVGMCLFNSLYANLCVCVGGCLDFCVCVSECECMRVAPSVVFTAVCV